MNCFKLKTLVLLVTCVLVFLPVLVSCDKSDEEVTEEMTEAIPSEGLEFTSNGDGTCYVSGIGTCTDAEVVIPKESPDGDKVTSIGEEAFWNCGSLTSMSIPDSVTSIGRGALADCSALAEITVSKRNPVYHSKGNCLIETASKTLIAGCMNSVIPEDGSVTSIGEFAFCGCRNLTSIVIPDSITDIGYSAFYICNSLTSITIPDSVTSIGNGAFGHCFTLAEIIVSDGNPVYHSEGNCLIETESKTLIAGCMNSVIPADGSVTSIGELAFRSCLSLRSITIPDSVTSIGESAFYNCSLTSIIIPNGVTSIGDRAFSECYHLTSITIPDSVTSIGDFAFTGTPLSDIYYGGTRVEWRALLKKSGGNDGISNDARVHYVEESIEEPEPETSSPE